MSSSPTADRPLPVQLVELLKHKTVDHKGIWHSILSQTPASNVRIFTPMDKLPHSNAPHPHVVFIGDSCHAMVPYSGEAAAAALLCMTW